MAINNITQAISTLPEAGRRGIDVQTQFVTKQEDFQDHLQGTTVTELNTLKDQLNSRIGEINSTTTTMNGYANTASAGASTATTKAGEASTSAGEALSYRNQAETFKNNASTSATKASQWADNNYNVEVETGKYSAKHWSTVAQNATANKIDKVTSTDNAIVRFDGVTGQVQNSGVIIDDNNNVGVGVTPSAWSTTNTKVIDLHTNGAVGIVNGGLNLKYNHYYNGTNDIYKVNGFASNYLQNSGQHYWYAAPSGTAGNAISWTNAMTLDGSGNLLLTSGTGALGYGAGSGGTVTQLTSKSTAVTLNKPSGVITMNAAALASGVTVSFTLNNSSVTASDNIIITFGAGSYSPYAYNIWCYPISGVLTINIKNISGISLSESVVINFAIIKGAVT